MTRWPGVLVRIRALDPGTGTYGVEAEPDGGRPVTGTFRLDAEALRTLELDGRRYGMSLSEWLLAGDVGEAYGEALRRASVRSRGRLRVRLEIEERAAEVHAIAWERLHHLLRRRHIPIAVSARTPFSRVTEADPGLETLATRSVRLAFAVSNPTDLPDGLQAIDVDEEIRALHGAIGDLGSGNRVVVTVLPGRSGLGTDLRQALEGDGYAVVEGSTSIKTLTRLFGDHDVVHILAHGQFGRTSPTGPGRAALFLEREDGRWEGVDDERLADLAAALDPSGPRLIVLSACESARQDPTHPLVGLAPKLVGAGVPAVIGMQARLPVSVARELTVALYRGLLQHGLVDVAVNEARLELFDRKQVDWSIPVLVNRLPDGRLFVPEDLAGVAVTGTLALRYTPHGVRADRRRAEAPVAAFPARALPRDVPDPIDRQVEIDAATAAIEAGRPVEIVGEAGVGKSTLLRHLVHRVAGTDGVVHGSARNRTADDLLQYLFDRVYRTEGSHRPTPGQLREALAGLRVLFALDDVELTGDEAGRLMDGAPAATFLLAGREPVLTGEGQTVQLGGLPTDAAVELLVRHLARELSEGEVAAGRTLAEELEGHPGRLIQAAARAADEGVSLADLASEASSLGTGAGGPSLGAVDVATLHEVERRVLAVMAALRGSPVRAEHLEALSGVPDLDEVVDRLRRDGLIAAASPAFTLTEEVGPEAERFLDVATWRDRVVEHFLEWAGRYREDTGRLLRSLDALLASMDVAWTSGRHREYLGLARIVGEPLLVTRRWGTWGAILERTLEAAEAVGDEAAQALAHHELGTRALGEGSRGVARSHLRRARRLRKALGDRPGLRVTRHNLRLVSATPWYAGGGAALVVAGAVAGILLLPGGGVSADPGKLSFPGVEVGTSSIEQTVRLTNTDDRAVAISAVQVGGPDRDQFLVNQGCTGRRLRSGESCPIGVRFQPTTGGTRSAELVIRSAAGDELRVAIEGRGAVTAALARVRPVEEGNGEEARSVGFAVTLSSRSTDEVTVEYQTDDGTAIGGEDYEEISGSLTFESGTTELTLPVPITGDVLDEPNRETFSLRLTEVDGSEVEDVLGEAIIRDDDLAPTITIEPRSVEEGDEGVTAATLQAVLSAESGRRVDALVRTIDGTATSEADYGVIEQALSWEPGETEADFSVEILGDVIDESDERFFLELSDLAGARRSEVEPEEGIAVTILDDDDPPMVFISDVAVLEGDVDAVTEFDITLSAPSGLPITVQAETLEEPNLDCDPIGSATVGKDYLHRTSEVTIPPGQTRAAFAVTIVGDSGTECGTERFLVELTNAVNTVIEDGGGAGTIEDDDPVE